MLYLVPTPIGNLEDITLRALRVLKEVDIIACEDTRNTQKLLNHFDIKGKKIISYHEHNEDKVSDNIINELKENKSIALVSDAGMPCISDPGYVLVKKCREENISLTTLPGANAGLCALVSSGIESYNYKFYGFLPRKSKDLKEKLKKILEEDATSIIYESPHRIKKMIEELNNLAPDRIISVARELTKLYEQVKTDTANNIFKDIGVGIKEKGEFVVIISPKEKEEKLLSEEEVIKLVKDKLDKQIKLTKAIKEVAKENNINKREVYKLYHEEYK